MQKDGFWILFSENQQQQHQLSALQIKVDANMESLARLAFLNGPSQVHIVVQFSFFLYLFILQMFFKSFKCAPFSLLTSKKYDKFFIKHKPWKC